MCGELTCRSLLGLHHRIEKFKGPAIMANFLCVNNGEIDQFCVRYVDKAQCTEKSIGGFFKATEIAESKAAFLKHEKW